VAAPAATRLLAIAGGDEPALAHAKLDALRCFVLLYGAARSWLWLAFNRDLDPAALAASAVALTLCAGLTTWPRAATWAPRLALPVLVVQLAWTFPLTNNHFFLELVCVGLLALVGPDRVGERVALDALCWVTALVLLHGGLSKVLYGLYFRGEFLAFMVGRTERFADVFRWLLPVDDVARLAGYDPLRAGDGPFRVASLPFVLAANLVYLLEITLAVLLLPRRTRTIAAACALVLVLVIQLGARELGFAILFGNLLLAFLPRSAPRLLLPVLALLFAWEIAAAFGWLPGRDWVMATNP